MFGKRKLRSEILFVFILLIAISSAIIIGFNYSKNVQSIRKFSQGTIDRVSALIVERIKCMLHELARLPVLGVEVFLRNPVISAHNEELISFFLTTVKIYPPNLYAYYVGTPDGSALIVFNLSVPSDKPYYFSNSKHRVPKETAYAIVLIDRSGGKEKEVWYFKDKDLNTISTHEFFSSIRYDPRIRPWYTGAVKKGKLYWTDIYTYAPTDDLGITVSKPLYNEKHELICVVGADLSLQLFSEFLVHQPIGTAGKAYILNESGNIIIPSKANRNQKDDAIVTEGYADSLLKHQKDFLFESQGDKYLGSIQKLKLDSGKHWNVLIIDPLSDYFSDLFKTQHQVVFISFAILVFAGLLVVYFSKRISEPIVNLAHEVDKLTRLELEEGKRVSSHIKEISLIDHSVAAMRVAIRSFSRYVPKDIVRQLLQQGKELVLGGEKRELTTLFADITEFSTIAEELPIEKINEMLTEYFEVVSSTILEQQGTVDKFIGDGVMAFWGAPNEVSNPSFQACVAALKCQVRLKKMNQNRKEKKVPEFFTRMGLEIGDAYVGNFGTLDRMNYTALGDSVNVAFRLEEINKKYSTCIIISDEVLKKADGPLLARLLDIIEIKGKKKRIKIFELVGLKKGDPEILATPEQIGFCNRFSQAVETYLRGDLSNAKEQFLSLQQKFPEDVPLRIYLEQLKG